MKGVASIATAFARKKRCTLNSGLGNLSTSSTKC